MASLRRRAIASRAAGDDAVRVVRSNLLVAIRDLRNPVVVITSAQAGEGKTSTAVALARSLAVAGVRVALVDVDLRRPAAHRLLGAPAGPGCADILEGRRSLTDCRQVLAVPGAPPMAQPFTFVPAGTTTDNATELLGGPGTGALLRELSDGADVVLLDAPPVLPVADTLVIGRLAAGAVLVVEARRTSATTAKRATSALIRNQTRILGVVLNQARPSDDAAAAAIGYGDVGAS